jgi:hypothetical protein
MVQGMITRLVIQTLVWFGLMGLLLFLPAGTLNWPSAWVYLAEMMSLSLVVGLVFPATRSTRSKSATASFLTCGEGH